MGSGRESPTSGMMNHQAISLKSMRKGASWLASMRISGRYWGKGRCWLVLMVLLLVLGVTPNTVRIRSRPCDSGA